MSDSRLKNHKNDIINLVGKGETLRQIAHAVGIPRSTTSRWIKELGLTLKRGVRGTEPKGAHFRCQCGETNPSKFYGNKKFICGACHNKYTLEQYKKKRSRGIAYLGGKCASCGWNKWPSGLDFHHRNAKEKADEFKNNKHWAWRRLKQELDKCILLCKNCHAGVHSGDLVLPPRPSITTYPS